MFFKRKCPHCGVRNPKERMTCAECGAPLALGQVEGRPAKVETTEEPSESTREETVARWRSRREQDQGPVGLKEVLWRRILRWQKLGKKVDEHDPQRIIIASTPFKWLVAILSVFAAAIFVGVFFDSTWGIVIAVLDVLFVLSELIGDKVTLDKPTGSIIMRKRAFFLIPRRCVILFSAVTSVTVDCQEVQTGGGESSSSHYEYRVSLTIGSEKVKIDQTGVKADMLNLASAISRFMGKELVDKSDKPEIDIFPTKTFDGDRLPRDWKL